MKNLEGIKVGDKVWSPQYGYGIVIEYDDISNYPLSVEFCDSVYVTDDYTIDGRVLYGDLVPSLFFDIPEFYKNKDFPKKKRWRASDGEIYLYVDIFGCLILDVERGFAIDGRRYKAGNYFQSTVDAKESKLYNSYTR